MDRRKEGKLYHKKGERMTAEFAAALRSAIVENCTAGIPYMALTLTLGLALTSAGIDAQRFCNAISGALRQRTLCSQVRLELL